MDLLVVDASALCEVLLRTRRGASFQPVLASAMVDLHVPALCDLEVASALRRALRLRVLSLQRAEQALEDYLDLPLSRHGHTLLLSRVLQLRNNLSVYDAAYVALAERLQARLLTADDALRRALESLSPDTLW